MDIFATIERIAEEDADVIVVDGRKGHRPACPRCGDASIDVVAMARLRVMRDAVLEGEAQHDWAGR